MELSPYVESLRADLVRAVETTGPEARIYAERLTAALDPAVRMALLEALSDAAAEITQELRSEAVEVRLKGREPQFVVSATAPMEDTAGETADDVDDDGDAIARITVRIPEGLKTRAEELAADLGQSLNTWIVAAIRRGARDRSIRVDLDLGSVPFGAGVDISQGRARSSRRIQGWAR